MEYARLLKRAAHVTWNYRALWLFGFFLALFGGGAGGSYGRGSNWNLDRTDLNRPEWVLGLVLLVVLAVVILAVLAIVLNGVSRGALIGMVQEVEESGTTSVRSGWKVGMSHLLSMIGIDLLTGIPAAIVAMVLVLLGASPLLLMLAGGRSPGSGETLAVLAVLFTILLELAVIALLVVGGVVLSVVVELAYRRCVLAGDGAMSAIRTAWNTFRTNLGRVGGLWLILLLLDLLAGAVMIPLYLLVFGASAGIGAIVYRSMESAAPAVLAGAIILIPGVVVASFVAGIYQAFRSAFWTLGYRELEPKATVIA